MRKWHKAVGSFWSIVSGLFVAGLVMIAIGWPLAQIARANGEDCSESPCEAGVCCNGTCCAEPYICCFDTCVSPG
jgi:hypothetical protein